MGWYGSVYNVTRDQYSSREYKYGIEMMSVILEDNPDWKCFDIIVSSDIEESPMILSECSNVLEVIIADGVYKGFNILESGSIIYKCICRYEKIQSVENDETMYAVYFERIECCCNSKTKTETLSL